MGASRQRLRVLLVQRRALILDGLHTLIETLEGVEVAGEAADGNDGMDAAREVLPDVVVASAQLSRISGLNLVHRLHDVLSMPRVVLIELREIPDAVAEAVGIASCDAGAGRINPLARPTGCVSDIGRRVRAGDRSIARSP